EHCKMRPEAFLPAYGMAEHTLAISFKPTDQPFRTHRVDGARFQLDGTVTPPVGDDDGLVFEHVSCGGAFPGHEIGVMGDDGTLLGDGREGELVLRGPSV